MERADSAPTPWRAPAWRSPRLSSASLGGAFSRRRGWSGELALSACDSPPEATAGESRSRGRSCGRQCERASGKSPNRPRSIGRKAESVRAACLLNDAEGAEVDALAVATAAAEAQPHVWAWWTMRAPPSPPHQFGWESSLGFERRAWLPVDDRARSRASSHTAFFMTSSSSRLSAAADAAVVVAVVDSGVRLICCCVTAGSSTGGSLRCDGCAFPRLRLARRNNVHLSGVRIILRCDEARRTIGPAHRTRARKVAVVCFVFEGARPRVYNDG